MPEMRGPGRGGGGYWNEPRGRGDGGGRGRDDYRQDSHPREPMDHAPYRQDDPYGRDRRGEDPHSRDRNNHPYGPDRRDDPYASERRANYQTMDRRDDPYARNTRADPYYRDPHARDPYSRDTYPRDARGDPYGRDRMDDPYARDRREPLGREGRDNFYPARRDDRQDKPMGGLLQKLGDCTIKDEEDAKLATSVITSLVKSLKDYSTISGKHNVASIMTEVELSIHKAKAMRVALKVLGTGPQTGQTAPK